MLISLLQIGIGGFLGAVSRYMIFMLFDRYYKYYSFPLGTLAVNLIGSFCIGLALGLSVRYGVFNRGSYEHFLFVTGYLGSFTTFSTFSQDNLWLLMDKHYLFFIINVVFSIIFGILLAALGYLLVVKKGS